MLSMRWAALAAAGMALAWPAAPQEKFHTRLAPVAMDATMRASVSGTGVANATLSGNKLTIDGNFDGLRSAATTAHLHLSRVAGVRGPAVLDLTVTHALTGSVAGSFDLNAEQVEALKKGRFYIQIESEKAPDGNLWGWLMR